MQELPKMLKSKNILLALFLSACSLQPDFLLPETPKPASFKEQAAIEGKWKPATILDEKDKGKWWKVFGDSKLNDLQEQLIKNNNSLKAAAARAKQYAQTANISEAGLLPSVTVDAGVYRQKNSGATINGSFNPKPTTTYNLNSGISYELDLFGKLSSEIDATTADFESEKAAYNNIMLILQAQTAQNYFNLKFTDKQKELLAKAIKIRSEQFDIIAKRAELGDVSNIELKQAETQLANIKLQALEIDRTRAKLEHSLAVLLGKAPSDFNLAKSPLKYNNPKIPVGIPSEVIQRRPDVSSATRKLQAANARIGVAKASFIPDIILSAAFGFQAQSLSDLIKWSSRTWLIGPAAGALISGTPFDGGKFEANLNRSKAAYEEASANYKQTILTAFQEVEDSLTDTVVIADQLKQAKQASDAAIIAGKLVKMKYDVGATSYFELKDAEATALNTAIQQIKTESDSVNAKIVLIKAIGGSW